MKDILLLGVLEIFPITMWIIAMSCTKNKSKYPNTSLGYKTPISTKSKMAWDYTNEFAGKLSNVLGIVLFIANALVIILTDIVWPMFIVNILAYIILHITVDKAVSKRFTEKGKIKKGI